MEKTIEIRKCVICDNVFMVTSRQIKKKYCDDCCKEVKATKLKEWKKQNPEKVRQTDKRKREKLKKPPKILKCQRCGNDYKSWKGKSLYCIDCLSRSTNKYERYRAWTRRVYE